MGSPEKTLVILGPTGAGKATTTGCMLFKYGGIDTSVMQTLEGLGVQDQNRRYGEAVDNLKRLKLALQFYTPKGHYVTVKDASFTQPDCAILVVSANLAASLEVPRELFGAAKQVVVVINKMDAVSWSEEQFQKAVEGLGDLENVPVIPISARDGDNIVEKSLKGPWYKGWKRGGQSGVTLLEALDASF